MLGNFLCPGQGPGSAVVWAPARYQAGPGSEPYSYWETLSQALGSIWLSLRRAWGQLSCREAGLQGNELRWVNSHPPSLCRELITNFINFSHSFAPYVINFWVSLYLISSDIFASFTSFRCVNWMLSSLIFSLGYFLIFTTRAFSALPASHMFGSSCFYFHRRQNIFSFAWRFFLWPVDYWKEHFLFIAIFSWFLNLITLHWALTRDIKPFEVY